MAAQGWHDGQEDLQAAPGVRRAPWQLGRLSCVCLRPGACLEPQELAAHAQLLVVVWHGESLPVGCEARPGSFRAAALVEAIVACAGSVQRGGWASARDFQAGGGRSKISLVLHQRVESCWQVGPCEREALIAAGVKVTDPGPGPAAPYFEVRQLLRKVALLEDPATTAVLLMCGAGDYGQELRLLREKGFRHLVLLHMGGAPLPGAELFASRDGGWAAKRSRAGLGELPSQLACGSGGGEAAALLWGASGPPLGAGPQKVCWHFRRGTCELGDKCKWLHTPPEPQALQGAQAAQAAGAAPGSGASHAAPTKASRHGVACAALGALRRLSVWVLLTLLVGQLTGTAWLLWSYREAVEVFEGLEDQTCRVSPQPWTPPAEELGWELLPVRSCWAQLEVLQECAPGAGRVCWQPLPAAFRAPSEASQLTFAFPGELLWPQYHHLQCAAVLYEYQAMPNGFDCSFAAGNPADFGVFALRKEAIRSALMLELAMASQADPFFRMWALATCLLAIPALWGLVVLLRCGRRLVSSKGRAFCRCLDKAAVLASITVMATAAAWLVRGYRRTWGLRHQLEDGTCRLATSDFREPPQNVWEAAANSTWVALPSRSCWVDLVAQLPCEGRQRGPCWAPLDGFRAADGLTLLTFDLRPSDQRLRCGDLVAAARLGGGVAPGGFNCSYAQRDAGGWGVFAAPRAALSEPALLGAAVAGTGAPGRWLLASLLPALCLLAVRLVLGLRGARQRNASAKAPQTVLPAAWEHGFADAAAESGYRPLAG